MARQYKSYEEDFKKTVVKLYETGKGVSELSREYGVGKSTIESWIKKFKTITTSTRNRNIKKSSSHILKEIDDKVKFIDDNKKQYNVRLLCKCLNIHHSVYYYHCNHKTNIYKEANEKLDIKIKYEFDASKKKYGSPKITRKLREKGIIVSQKRVARRMQILNLRSITVKKYNHAGKSTTDNTKDYSNLLNQDFKVEKPSKKWVGDITYIYTE